MVGSKAELRAVMMGVRKVELKAEQTVERWAD